jgi:hypothetical protein
VRAASPPCGGRCGPVQGKGGGEQGERRERQAVLADEAVQAAVPPLGQRERGLDPDRRRGGRAQAMGLPHSFLAINLPASARSSMPPAWRGRIG